MVKSNTPGRKQVSGTPKAADTTQGAAQAQPLNTTPAPARKKSSKSNRSAVGGTAIPGAKSTLPKQMAESASQQQQQQENSNREMRRRMERLGYNDNQERAKTTRDVRKERQARIKARQQQQLAQIKKSLPGGKIDTSQRRVYIMIAVVATAIILLIAIFVILRVTHVLS